MKGRSRISCNSVRVNSLLKIKFDLNNSQGNVHFAVVIYVSQRLQNQNFTPQKSECLRHLYVINQAAFSERERDVPDPRQMINTS